MYYYIHTYMTYMYLYNTCVLVCYAHMCAACMFKELKIVSRSGDTNLHVQSTSTTRTTTVPKTDVDHLPALLSHMSSKVSASKKYYDFVKDVFKLFKLADLS